MADPDVYGIPWGRSGFAEVHAAGIAATVTVGKHRAAGRRARVFSAVLAYTVLWSKYIDRVSLAALAEMAGVEGRFALRGVAADLTWLAEIKAIVYVHGTGRHRSIVGVSPVAAGTRLRSTDLSLTGTNPPQSDCDPQTSGDCGLQTSGDCGESTSLPKKTLKRSSEDSSGSAFEAAPPAGAATAPEDDLVTLSAVGAHYPPRMRR